MQQRATLFFRKDYDIIRAKKGEVLMVIRYPTGKSLSTTTTTPLDGYQHRGLDFETDINTMNQRYRDTNRAIIYKKPTPIKVGKIQHRSKAGPLITEAYFEMPSTTDYNGIYRGRYIDFEAKETRNKTAFPFANLHAHQIEHLQQIIAHGGIGFLLVHFVVHQQVYLLDGQEVAHVLASGRKSIPLDYFRKYGIEIPWGYVERLPYLDAVDQRYF
ncbi:MAG: Holliday junction resolvase RecU [Petrimonas sp.]|jgi:recombination protein U|nr:Holliday junction resolvase RecU [Petrimonas sp.]